MELNMKVLVKVAVMLFLLGITATVEARFDARSFIKEVLPNGGSDCACTFPYPIYFCNCPGEVCGPACSGACICVVYGSDGTRDCNCVVDKTTFFAVAGAHKV